MPFITPLSVRLTAALFAAYTIGGVSPGWWLVRRAGGGDLRKQGSGATGATNAGRLLGDRGFLIVLALDAAKGALALVIARLLVPDSPWYVLGFPAAVAGHIWPVWLGFCGGRGAATLLGASLVMHPQLPLAGLVPGLILLAFTGKRFLAGATAFAATLLLMWWMLPSVPERVAYLAASGMVLLAHRNSVAKHLPL
jgi:acyl phosphate:glycerol-3-phosphate acyltransferase